MIGPVKVSMRDRLIEAATELFYAEGLRAVSVDRVIERAGTTKVTFYRHFKSKDDLVVAHLERRAQQEREGVGAAMEHADGDPDHHLGGPAQPLAVGQAEGDDRRDGGEERLHVADRRRDAPRDGGPRAALEDEGEPAGQPVGADPGLPPRARGDAGRQVGGGRHTSHHPLPDSLPP